MKRPFSFYILFSLLLFLGINATIGGGMLIVQPDGSLLGMQPNWLEHAPFNNYLLPGLTLFLINGIFPLFILIGLARKPSWKWAKALNIFPEMHWAWTYSLYAGVIVIIWIAFQMIMTPYFWLQPVIIFVGLLIIICTMMPALIKFFELKNKPFIV
jgi:hypothetical protein